MRDGCFKIDRRSIASVRWGDYGDILQHGMAAHMPRIGGRLSLERTGPYIPPITLPGIGEIVLTSEARESLEGSELSGFSFVPVEKSLVVELHWENWDFDADEPEYYPESGEPEDYILGQPHNPPAAAALGELWEVVIPVSAKVLRPRSVVSSFKELKLDLNTWSGADLIRGEGYGSPLFTKRARDWFISHWDTYIRFEQFPTT